MNWYMIVLGSVMSLALVTAGGKQSLPDRCSFGSEIGCRDYMVNYSNTDSVKMELINNFGYNVKITDLEVSYESKYGFVVCDKAKVNGTFFMNIYSWEKDDLIYVGFDCEQFQQDNKEWLKQKIYINISTLYDSDTSNVSKEHQTNGEIFTTIQSSNYLKKLCRTSIFKNIILILLVIGLFGFVATSYFYKPMKKYRTYVIISSVIIFVLALIIKYLSILHPIL